MFHYQENSLFDLSKDIGEKNDLSKNNGIHRDKLFTGAVSLEKLILDDRNEKHHKAFENNYKRRC